MTLLRTWTALVVLSGLTTALTAFDPMRPVLVLGVLILAGLKAQLILGQFLNLQKAPALHRGFGGVLALLLVLFGTLLLAA